MTNANIQIKLEANNWKHVIKHTYKNTRTHTHTRTHTYLGTRIQLTNLDIQIQTHKTTHERLGI